MTNSNTVVGELAFPLAEQDGQCFRLVKAVELLKNIHTAQVKNYIKKTEVKTPLFVIEANRASCSKYLQILVAVRHIQSPSPEVIWQITVNHAV